MTAIARTVGYVCLLLLCGTSLYLRAGQLGEKMGSRKVCYTNSVSLLGPTLVVGDDDVIGEDVMDDGEAEVMDETEEVCGYW